MQTARYGIPAPQRPLDTQIASLGVEAQNALGGCQRLAAGRGRHPVPFLQSDDTGSCLLGLRIVVLVTVVLIIVLFSLLAGRIFAADAPPSILLLFQIRRSVGFGELHVALGSTLAKIDIRCAPRQPLAMADLLLGIE